jgi:CDP-paratose 2-epimerase
MFGELMKILVTGSGGLIGSEAVRFYAEGDKENEILGIDNNMRKYMFGDSASTNHIIKDLQHNKNFKNYKKDIRNRKGIDAFFKKHSPFDMIIHTAAAPAHDWAVKEPYTDHDINDNGTFALLESYRTYSPKATFIHCSTSKLYGDNPNRVALEELETRYDYAKEQTMIGVSQAGITEEFSIDNCLHSLFGASKTAGDIAAQEYGKYFGLNVGIFRGDCLSGRNHQGTMLHGYLSYICSCAVNKKPYTVIGYKGKQVRGQIHAYDCITAFDAFHKNPKHGEVYNLGGGKANAISILETVEMLEKDFDLKLEYQYQEKPRIGDHIVYYSDISKLKSHFPEWKITKNVKEIMADIIEGKSNGNKAPT